MGKYDYPPQGYPHSRPQSSYSQFHSSEETSMQSPSFHINESPVSLSHQLSSFEIPTTANSTDDLENGTNPLLILSKYSNPQND